LTFGDGGSVLASLQLPTPYYRGPSAIEPRLPRGLLNGGAQGALRGDLRIEAMPNDIITFAALRTVSPYDGGDDPVIDLYVQPASDGGTRLRAWCGEGLLAAPGDDMDEMELANRVVTGVTYDVTVRWQRGASCTLFLDGQLATSRTFPSSPPVPTPDITELRLGIVDYDDLSASTNVRGTLRLDNWRYSTSPTGLQ
jgi:hypothetical protein